MRLLCDDCATTVRLLCDYCATTVSKPLWRVFGRPVRAAVQALAPWAPMSRGEPHHSSAGAALRESPARGLPRGTVAVGVGNALRNAHPCHARLRDPIARGLRLRHGHPSTPISSCERRWKSMLDLSMKHEGHRARPPWPDRSSGQGTDNSWRTPPRARAGLGPRAAGGGEFLQQLS